MATGMNNWLDVDRKGLAEIVERRGGKVWLLHELLSNCFDENVTTVKVILEPEAGKPFADLYIEDDSPDGWKDLRDSYTLFAPSKKKADPEKRGRFNLGEKLVLALCREASIVTTTGSVLFEPSGRKATKARRELGSTFDGVVRMTRDELAECLDKVRAVIAPAGVSVTINGEPLPERPIVKTFRACLQTEHADEEGVLRRTFRHADVRLYRPLPGHTGMIFELGIPVIETGDSFDVDVRQRVPLNVERDNVTPSYLRDLRAAVLKNAHDQLDDEAKRAGWVTDALTEIDDPGAIDAVLTARFGDKRVSYDPSDPEANHRAVAEGYTVIHGRQLPAEAWEKIRPTGLVQPAGRVTPTPKHWDEDAPKAKQVDIETLDGHKRQVVALFRAIGRVVLGRAIKVQVIDEPGFPVEASYRALDALLVLNLPKIQWYDSEYCIALALHEYAHAFCDNHLDEKYHDAICRLGAKLARACYANLIIPFVSEANDALAEKEAS